MLCENRRSGRHRKVYLRGLGWERPLQEVGTRLGLWTQRTYQKQMSDSEALRAQLERLAQEVTNLQAQRQQLTQESSSSSSSVDVSDAVARLDAAIAQTEAHANEILVALQTLESERSEGASSRKRRLDDAEEPPTKRMALAEDMRDLALKLTLARGSASEQEKFRGVSRDLYAQYRAESYPVRPFTPREQAAFFQSLPKESKVMEYLFRRGTDLRANNNAALKFCAMQGYVKCVRALLDAKVTAEDSESLWVAMENAYKLFSERPRSGGLATAVLLLERAPASDALSDREIDIGGWVLREIAPIDLDLFVKIYEKFPQIRFAEQVIDLVESMFRVREVVKEEGFLTFKEIYGFEFPNAEFRRKLVLLAAQNPETFYPILTGLDTLPREECLDLFQLLVNSTPAEFREELASLFLRYILRESTYAAIRKRCSQLDNMLAMLQTGLLDPDFQFELFAWEVDRLRTELQLSDDPFWSTVRNVNNIVVWTPPQVVQFLQIVRTKFCAPV